MTFKYSSFFFLCGLIDKHALLFCDDYQSRVDLWNGWVRSGQAYVILVLNHTKIMHCITTLAKLNYSIKNQNRSKVSRSVMQLSGIINIVYYCCLYIVVR